MNIIFVVDSFQVGGSELAALRTTQLLRPHADIAVIHFHADGPLRQDYEQSGARLVHVPIRGFTDPRNILAIATVRRTIRSLQADVVHSHDAYSNMVMLAAAWPSFRTPWISSRRWLDQIVRPVHARLNHTAFVRSRAVTVNSQAVADHMIRNEGVPASQVVVVPNFVSVPEETPPPSSGAGDVVTIGMVSRLTPIKRHDIALRAIKALRDTGVNARLVVIGDGESRESIVALARQLDIAGAVELLGQQRGGSALHQQFDISLATSDSEGSPNSVLEGMAAGRAVVATAVGGTPDVVRDGIDGALVPPNDVDAVVRALSALVQDPQRRKEIGDAGRQRAIRDFSAQSVSETLMGLYGAVARG